MAVNAQLMDEREIEGESAWWLHEVMTRCISTADRRSLPFCTGPAPNWRARGVRSIRYYKPEC